MVVQWHVGMVVAMLATFLCVPRAEAFWAMQIYSPEPSGSHTAYGGLFSCTGFAESDGTITGVSVFQGTNKLGNATLAYRDGTQQTQCNWTFPWSNIVAQTTALRVVGYSTSAQGAHTVSLNNVTFTLAPNRSPEALMSRAHASINATNQPIKTVYHDPDGNQFWTAIPIGMPQHGSVSNATGSSVLTYTPSNGFCGLDSFMYMISDGVTTSAPASCQVLVHEPDHPAGSWVLLLVNSNLFGSAASNAIIRLKSDLEAEGYTTHIRTWPATGTTASQVWQCLRDAYTNTEHFMVGAILLGDFPKPSARSPVWNTTAVNELLYWNMKTLQTSSSVVNDRHIWVSRINAESTNYGATTTLVIRALDANHAYRKGESRLPFTAYRYRIPEKANVWEGDNLSMLWPVVERRGAAGATGTNLCFLPSRTDLGNIDGADCLLKGGELFEQVSHGNSSGYMRSETSGAWLTAHLVHRNLVQARFCIMGSCKGGTYGGIGNEQLFTRGGGCVLVTGATTDSYQGPISPNATFVALLAAGYSWGDSLVQELGVGNNDCNAFSGDLSLRPMASVYANAMPVISNFTASSTSTSAGLAVNFSVAAYDPDGVISNIEWFLTGYGYGTNTPTISGTATNVSFIYGTPGTYTARVEAMDNYQARVWREMTINVSAAVPHTLTITLAGQGASSLGALSPATRTIAPGSTTQVVFTAGNWSRLQTLFTNGVAVDAAAGTRVFTQLFAQVSGPISNAATFALLTPHQTGFTNVPTAWLAHWPEGSILTDATFSVYTKYLLGLSPATSNTFALQLCSSALVGSNLVTTIQRHYTGQLAPEGMQGTLVLQAASDLANGFTNLPATAITGTTAFDGSDTRTYTNAVQTPRGYFRARIE
jgi:hypothetical protein